MCLNCTERAGILLAKTLASGQNITPELEKEMFFDAFYILESDNPLPAINRIQDSLLEIIIPKDPETWGKSISPTAAICRVGEILITKGFSSTTYQSLIENRNISQLINSFFSTMPPFSERLLAQGSKLNRLVEEKVFFSKEGEHFISSKEFKEDCIVLLQNYINWWHNHQGFRDGKEEMKEEIAVFMKLFPYVFLSFVTIQRFSPAHSLIDQLINVHIKAPVGNNFDLWLQRVAARHINQIKGIDALLPYSEKCRPVILYYLLLSNQFTEEAKQKLKASILQSGKYRSDEPISNLALKANLFYQEPEKFIMAEFSQTKTG